MTMSNTIYKEILKYSNIEKEELKSVERDNYGGTYYIITLSNGLRTDFAPDFGDDLEEIIEWVNYNAPLRLVHKNNL